MTSSGFESWIQNVVNPRRNGPIEKVFSWSNLIFSGIWTRFRIKAIFPNHDQNRILNSLFTFMIQQETIKRLSLN